MKKTHLIGLIFLVIAIGAIISTLYNADTYASFADARLQPGREFHIIGRLNRAKPIEERVEEHTLILSFYLFDQDGEEQEVLFFGSKPQDFEQSDEVVLIGRYEADVFVASSLLLKCPSKYTADGIGDTEYLIEN
ncbi:MAG: cytochrome c maturation protein CcmE [Bacteroidales bacterium]|nr:cytochrome c maturation protein CcmE [Bacteroidales bacterium]